MSPFLPTLALVAVFFSSALALSLGFPYGDDKVRGVNLGGWLVLEVRLSLARRPNSDVSFIYSALDYAKSLRCDWR